MEVWFACSFIGSSMGFNMLRSSTLLPAFTACYAASASAEVNTANPLRTHLESLTDENPAASYLEVREQLTLKPNQVSRLQAI
jgi:hypothetical protein